MSIEQERVAVIGAGVSGIAAANVWQKCGYDVTVYEASDRVGGQWAKSYAGVRLQNTAPQYQFADFPWPFEPDRHPTGEQVLRYLEAAVEAFELDVRLGQRVTELSRTSDGWSLTVDGETERVAYVVVATGQYPGDAKHVPAFEGLERFEGEVVTRIDSHSVFEGKRVAVIGFGKTALDFASWSAEVAERTVHVFRTPRWTLPDTLLGIDYTRPFFARFGSDMMPSWEYSSPPQRFLHTHLSPVVRGFWHFIATLFLFQHRRDAKLGAMEEHGDARRLDAVMPPKSQFLADLRSASAVAPGSYYRQVAHGQIEARRSELASFYEGGVVLADGQLIEADVVAVCCGNTAPTYPYFAPDVRALLEGHDGGPPLYRHLVHPQIPGLGFAGYNHGFLHIALCEMGSLWQVAAHRGEIELPSSEHMQADAERVAAWKRQHSTFEPTANMAVNTRYQQTLDNLLQELGLSPWRKLPNLPAELLSRYDPTDYAGVVAEYAAKRPRARPVPSERPSAAAGAPQAARITS